MKTISPSPERSLPRALFFALLIALHVPVVEVSGQTHPGNLNSYSVEGKAITLLADSGRIQFVFFAADIVRVNFFPTPASVPDSSFVVVRDTTETGAVSVVDEDSVLRISTPQMHVTCEKKPLRISYYDASMALLLTEGSSGGFTNNGQSRGIKFELRSDDHFYGTGERGTALDKRGQSFGSYNDTFFGYTTALPRMNINIPFLANPNGFALYFEDTYGGQFDLGATDPASFSYTASGGELSYFLITASTVQAQLERYTWLTGRQPLPPRWAFGYIQSKFGYQNESEARSMVQTMRQEQIPCDAIVLDIYWSRYMGDLSWNPGSWPAPFQMMSDFLKTGIKTIVITEPYVTSQSPTFAEATTNGYFANDSNGQTYRLSNWWACNCDAGLVDLTSPAVQAWWWGKHPSFLGTDSAGVAGLWTDLGEPEQHPSDMRHYLGSAAKVHNIFNLLWARTVFEGFRQLRPNSRLFNLTRAGYAGIQRFGVIPWSADVGNDFGGLEVQLPMLLNMGMSGLAYHNSDIGGFCCGSTTPELYVRWIQYGTFCPITRAHGTGRLTEPWGYGAQAESIARQFIRLRYQLLPYIYTMAYVNQTTGLPLARPLFFLDSSEPSLLNLGTEYMWGDQFLVSPVVTAGQINMNVFLPAGVTWVDYWSGQRHQGGQYISVSTPLGTMPLFVKAGSIIPMQPVMDYSDQRPLDTLMLDIYPWPESSGTFSLYEDDGKSLGYQSGESALTSLQDQLTGSGESSTLTIGIGATIGTYAGKPVRRVYVSTVHGIASKPLQVTMNGRPVAEHASYTELRQGGDGFCFDSLAHELFIQSQTVPDSSYTIIVGQVRLTDVSPGGNLSLNFRLNQNYPNPFNPTTVINYQLPAVSEVKLIVYDILGRNVATLVEGRQGPGSHTVEWHAEGMASGVYFVRLQAGPFAATKKLVLLK
jgi:alpha-glucosidase (family GH31 glycosyl hydrolase)